MLNKIRQNLGNIIYYVVAILFAALMAGYRISNLMHNPVGFANYLKFHYDKQPFILRTLIPTLGKGIHYVTKLHPEVIFPFLEFLGIFLIILFFKKYLKLFIKREDLSKIFSFSILFLFPFEMLLPRYWSLWFPYCVYGILFIIILLYLLHEEKYWLYFPVFILGTFNRETTLYVTMISFFVLFRRCKFTKLIAVVGGQIIVWIAIKVLLSKIFTNTGGALFQYQYMNNVNFILDPEFERRFPNYIYEIFFRPPYLIGNLGFLWLLVIMYFKELDVEFLRRAFYVLIPYMLIMLYVSNIYEYRIFGDMMPIVLTPAIYIIIKLIKKKENPSISKLNS